MGLLSDFKAIKPSSDEDLALNRANDLVNGLEAEWTPELQTFIIKKMIEIINERRVNKLKEMENELFKAQEELTTI